MEFGTGSRRGGEVMDICRRANNKIVKSEHGEYGDDGHFSIFLVCD